MNCLSKDNVQDILELSLVQKAVLPNGTLTQVAYELQGNFDSDRLQQAWEETVATHQALRSVFRTLKNRTVQVLLKQRPIPIEWLDLYGMEEEEQQTKFQSVANSHREPIEIETGPLIRLAVCRFNEERTVILWTHHALCMDDHSRDRIFNEWMDRTQKIMQAGFNYKSYKEYLAWEAGQDGMPAKKYWIDQLTGYEPIPMLQLMHSQTEGKGNAHSCSTLLSEELSKRLEQIAVQHHVSEEALLLVTWLLLLKVYSGEKSVSCGATVSGRPMNWEEDIIGPFAHNLLINTTLTTNQRLGEVFATVQKQWEQLQEISHVPSEIARTYVDIIEDNSLFDSSVTVRRSVNNRYCNPYLLYRSGKEQIEAIVTIGSRWKIELFQPNSSSLPALKRLLEHFVTLLESISNQSDAQLRELNLLSDEERQLLLVDFNRTKLAMPPLNRLAHQVIEEQVEKRPHAIAAICGVESITYRELNKRANQLAHWLRERGFGRDDTAALLAERNIDMLVGILAVLKAGGAYVPLDSTHPDNRLLTILDNSGAKVILTESKWQSRSLELSKNILQDIMAFSLDTGDGSCADIEELASYSVENPTFINEQGDLANVFFTSGSTGQPKGAMVEHIGMLNHLYAKIYLLGLNENSIVAQNASHCFDISVWQFLAPLMTGGQVIIYSNEVATDPQALFQAVHNDHVTVLEMVPAIIELFLQAASDELNCTLPQLEFMISTGEGLPVSLCRKWLTAYPHVKVVNTYGATECSDDTSHEVICGIYPYKDHPQVVLGTPIPNIHHYLLDADQRPVPIGCIGEVYITGIGVGRGYLNDPERTAQAFLPNPFSDGMGERMYKTGDLARFTPDGQLVFISRADFQVKVRGYRIELGEIESTLLSHQAVSQCLAIVRKDRRGNNRILVYLMLNASVDVIEIRQYLQKHLPEYMVPEHIIILKEMPLNRNGKIDRKALPDPDESERESTNYIAPRNVWEIMLVKIWEEVLEISPIGIDDNFFDLGGHSLKTIQIRSRIKQQFNVEIPLKNLFDYQTIRKLSPMLKEALDGEGNIVEGIIPQVGPAEFYPMSHAQQRLFLLHCLDPYNLSYNMPVAIELVGFLDLEAFQQAFQSLLNRHEGLRTTFAIHDEKPVQRVSESLHNECLFIDLSDEDEKVQQQKIEDISRCEEEINFDLTSGPLFRMRLCKLASDRHVFWMNMHHIIGDYWSWQVLMKDFAALYESYCQRRIPLLPPLIVQYKDYASWQNDRLQRGELVEAERYWLEQFNGDLPILDLPLDHPRPSIQTFAAAQETCKLNLKCLNKLKELAQRQEATLYMTILSAVGAFLSRMSGQQDIVIGTPEAGRNHVELEGLLGFFVNTLPLRLRLSDDQTFIELLQHCKRTALNAFAHHEYPFDQLVEKIKLERDLSRSPLFSVMFQLIHSTTPIELGNLSFRQLPTGTDMTNFDLMIICAETGEGLDIQFKYRTDLYEAETIQRWIKHFTVMIDSILNDPDNKVSDLLIMDEPQKNQLLINWNNTRHSYPIHSCVHQLFEQTVLTNSDRIAVEYGKQYLTYHQLERRANQLANYLRKQGVGVGVNVAVCLDRSLEMVVALLGILKAGGTYVPLDPNFPSDRLTYMLENSSVKVALTDRLSINASVPDNVLIIDLEMVVMQISAESEEAPSFPMSSEQTAYLIYTSGSTGKPKGVQVSHRSLVNFLTSMADEPGICAADRLLSVTTLSFDIFGLELFLPLITGATVVLISREESMDGVRLAQVIQESKATIMQATPATWRLLIEAGWQGSPQLKILCGGEMWTRELAKELQARSGELWNMYGPTETTIWSAIHHVTEQEGSVRIGRPIGNTELYVLNSEMKPVPIGVPGELYIGGDGVAQGYWRRSDLTDERFLMNPFTGQGRIYRTGDLVRYLADGTLECLGRIDHQVKIRGYRIELSEIEIVLQQHSDISEAVVVAQDDILDEKKLVAYLVPVGKGLPTHEELRKHCLTQLPEYMVPSAFIELDKIPLTSNGKVDRKQLTDLNVSLSHHTYEPPRDLNELYMVNIWEEMLNVKPIGINDNFFAIGGYSLKALLLQNVIRERFGVELPLTALFQNPTVAELCTHLQEEATEHGAFMIQLQQGDGKQPPLVLIHPHGGGVLPYIHLVKALGPQETVYGIQAIGYESDERPVTSIEEMVALYVEEIRRVVPQGPYRLMGWSFGGTVAYEIARQLEHLDEKIEFVGLLDAEPLDEAGVIYEEFTERDAIDYFATLFELEPCLYTQMDPEKALKVLLQKAKECGKWTQGMTLDSIRRKIRVLVACSQARVNYRYQGPIRSNLQLFCVHEVSKHLHPLVNSNEWIPRTTGNVTVFDVPGDHNSMVEPPHVSKLAEVIQSVLVGEQVSEVMGES